MINAFSIYFLYNQKKSPQRNFPHFKYTLILSTLSLPLHSGNYLPPWPIPSGRWLLFLPQCLTSPVLLHPKHSDVLSVYLPTYTVNISPDDALSDMFSASFHNAVLHLYWHRLNSKTTTFFERFILHLGGIVFTYPKCLLMFPSTINAKTIATIIS